MPDRRAKGKFLAAKREAQKVLAGYEVRPYKFGGWGIYVRGTKIQVGRLRAGARGVAAALIATCDYFEFLKKPPRKLRRTMKWSGTRRPDGSYIPVAERRAKALSNAATIETVTLVDPPLVGATLMDNVTPSIDSKPVC